MQDQHIELNFLELTPQKFSFTVYRKEFAEGDLCETVFKYRLPTKLGDQVFKDFSIALSPLENFESFICNQNTNKDLTLRVLYYYLAESLREKELEFSTGKKFYDKLIEFTVKEHSKGKEKISLNPYLLKHANKFGFLIDFFFKVNEGQSLDRDVLKLSLALGHDGRSNKNFYSDHYHKLQSFLKGTFLKIADFNVQTSALKISADLIGLGAKTLDKKVYRFKSNQTDTNQFNGVRKYGPYQEVNQQVRYAFIFTDNLKSFANNLFFSLIGKSNPGTFSGMNQFFNLPFSNDLVKRIPLESYKREDVKKGN